MITKMDSLVEQNVRLYKTDWYEIDRPKAVEETAFVVFLRETGVDTLFLNRKKSLPNLLWIEACLDSERSKKIVHCHDGVTEEIEPETARRLWKHAKDTLPEGYIEYHESLPLSREAIPLQKWDVAKWKAGDYTVAAA